MAVRRPPLDQAEHLRAVAHRVRMDLLDLLESGPLTAADAARTLGQTPSNVSWHLRHLARYGLVRQLPEQSGRRRPWKVVTHAVSADEATVPGSAGRAREAYDAMSWERDLNAARSARTSWPTNERERRPEPRHERLWLTDEQAAALDAALDAAVAPYRAAQRPDAADGETRLMSVATWVVPTQ